MTIDYAKARETMVEQQVRPWDVFDPRVLDTLASLPRERFVAESHRALAYSDLALPLGHGRHMFKPVLEGRALQALAVQAEDKVLEIGTGSGYLTACFARLAREVVSLEIHADLADAAAARLQVEGVSNARVLGADALTWETDQRFDAICVGAAVTELPSRVLQWLRPGGRLFAVRGHAPAMEAVLVRADGAVDSLFETELEYLIGAEPPRTFAL